MEECLRSVRPRKRVKEVVEESRSLRSVQPRKRAEEVVELRRPATEPHWMH